ncbi:MAG: polysaccharide biosynthesis tyrosine autokinase [Verrucomicrobiota bacterium]|nr:polysaccharide biosynthesis tyrosine autokinase [Verrucomicrobiota bacterium]
MHEVKSSTAQRASNAAMAAKISRYLALLKWGWWILLLTTSVGLAAAAIYVYKQPPSYQSSAKMMVSGKYEMPTAAYREDAMNYFGTQIQLMQSAVVADKAGSRVRIAHPEMETGRVNPRLEMTQSPGASIFILRATGQMPAYTQAFLEACMEEYMEMKRESRRREADLAVRALVDELDKLRAELKIGQEQLTDFQKRYKLVFLEQEGNSAGKSLIELRQKLEDSKRQLNFLNLLTIEQHLEQELPKSPPTPSPKEPNATKPESELLASQEGYQKAKMEIRPLEKKRAHLLETLRPKHPMVVDVEAKIAEQENALDFFREKAKIALAARKEALQLEIRSTQTEIEQLNTKALELGEKITEYSTLNDKVELTNELISKLSVTVNDVKATKNIDQEEISVLEHATISKEVRPGLANKIALGCMAGLIAGLGILFLIDRSNDKVNSIDEFQVSFGERILGMVPEEPEDCRGMLGTDRVSHPFAESFNNLRSSLFYLPYDGPMPKVLLITSATPNEGKSTISSNLALAFAFAGAKTLLIDADVRRGVVHEAFGISNEGGLSEVLLGTATAQSAMKSTKLPNLFLLPRGKVLGQASRYFVHHSTDALLRELHQEFDHILIDSSPVLAADDTTSLAPKADATLLVVRLGFSRLPTVRAALDLLYNRQANLLGVIVNGINTRDRKYNYYQYAEYYVAEEKEPAKV